MNRGFLVTVFLAIFVCNQYEVTARPPIRIVNGTTAAEGEFPYAVELLSDYGIFLCGGSIIAREWILTAGHCIKEYKPVATVVYGTTKRFDMGDTLYIPNTSIGVKQMYQHPSFRHNSYGIPEYDIGILQLAEPITFNEFAQPIKVAESNINIPVHKEGVLCGWGGNNHNGNVPSYLQKINLQLLTDDECTKQIDDYEQEEIFNSTHNLCTNDNYNGGCYGDSGSPYVINGTQYAVMSWSSSPCYGIVPNSYSRITNPEYRNWIRNITNV